MSDSPVPLPLAGLRVLAVEQYGAGPAGTIYLADLGAEVIKIENLREGGDVGRHVGPHFFGPGDSQFYQTFNRNKRSIALDLRSAEGIAVFRDLARTADGVVDNLRGDLRPDLRSAARGQPAHRVLAPVGLWQGGLARRLAGLRLPHAGGSRPHVADR
jgi:hypothetical protein